MSHNTNAAAAAREKGANDLIDTEMLESKAGQLDLSLAEENFPDLLVANVAKEATPTEDNFVEKDEETTSSEDYCGVNEKEKEVPQEEEATPSVDTEPKVDVENKEVTLAEDNCLANDGVTPSKNVTSETKGGDEADTHVKRITFSCVSPQSDDGSFSPQKAIVAGNEPPPSEAYPTTPREVSPTTTLSTLGSLNVEEEIAAIAAKRKKLVELLELRRGTTTDENDICHQIQTGIDLLDQQSLELILG